ncbi:tetratricopeptide repeat-containing sulfotransferase family protein [Desulfolithobacter sp.]
MDEVYYGFCSGTESDKHERKMKRKKHSPAYKLCLQATKAKQKGSFNKALTLYNRALKINPFHAVTYYERSDLPNLNVTDKELARMESIFSKTSNQQDKILIAFALARAYDKREQYEKAFDRLQVGNKLKRETVDYDPATIRKDIVRIMEVFTEFEFLNTENQGHDTRRPIFILGMPRSGTTLIEQIISSHPDVVAGGELYALNRAVAPAFSSVNMAAPMGKKLAGVNKDIRSRCVDNYLKMLPGKGRRVTDKMPSNFLHVGWICLLFNQAKIIHVKRNKMATIFSCYQQYFAHGNEYSYDLYELSEYYDSYDLLMQYWGVLFKDRIYHINYEDIVLNQEEETRKVIEYCGLEWNDACLSFEKNKRTVTTLSTGQVRQPIYKTSLNHWKNYASYIGSLNQ